MVTMFTCSEKCRKKQANISKKSRFFIQQKYEVM